MSIETEGKPRGFKVGTTGDVLVSLTSDEVRWMNDAISGPDIKYNGEDKYPILDAHTHRELRLKLMSGYIQSFTTSPIEFNFYETELWLMKDKIQTGDGSPSDREFGVRLVKKICEALLELDNQES